MTNEILPKGYGYCYQNDVIRIAREMKSKVYLDKTPEGKLFVIVEHVFIKIKSYAHKPIQGIGITLEDACEDYMRQARGLTLIHVLTDKEGTYV